jgi:uncharacterized membrane protein YhaH (DUF805 family)
MPNALALLLDNGGAGAIAGIIGLLIQLVNLAVLVVLIAGLWKTFVKTGRPGWYAIIPIYNFIVILEIAGKPIWWIILMLIPCVNIIVSVLVGIEVAKKFGKDTMIGVLCGLPILMAAGYAILGFGDAQYQGGAGGGGEAAPPAAG